MIARLLLIALLGCPSIVLGSSVACPSPLNSDAIGCQSVDDVFNGINQQAPALLTVGGPVSTNVGIGESNPPFQSAAAVEFTVNTPVTISFTAGTVSAPGFTLTYWLTNNLGNTTTTANVLSTGTLTTGTGSLTLFTDLTLTQGTYYVTLALVGQINEAGWDVSRSTVVTTTGFVNYVDSFLTPGNGTDAPGFAPAYTNLMKQNQQNNLLFEIDGSAVPEPSTTAITFLGCAGLWLAGKRAQRNMRRIPARCSI